MQLETLAQSKPTVMRPSTIDTYVGMENSHLSSQYYNQVNQNLTPMPVQQPTYNPVQLPPPVHKPLIEPPKTKYDLIPNNYTGSQGQAMGNSNNIKILPDQTKFNVHAPKGLVTGANVGGTEINNYQAAMIDLIPGKTVKQDNLW